MALTDDQYEKIIEPKTTNEQVQALYARCLAAQVFIKTHLGVTDEEFEQAVAMCTAKIDQIAAEATERFKKESPIEYMLRSILG